jgi:hypothetical protein
MDVASETGKDERLRLLLAHLDAAWEMLDSRLHERRPWQNAEDIGGEGAQTKHAPVATLTDEEYFWEPVANCWSLRRRGQAKSSAPVGKGEWLLDGERPAPEIAPFTTIAWRMCHICVSPLFRYDYTFGSHSLTMEDVEWPATAADAVAFLGDAHFSWRNAIAEMPAEELDQVGRSQFPGGLDPHVRFDDLIAWTNTEFTHHAAEIACLRDLYRHRGAGKPSNR